MKFTPPKTYPAVLKLSFIWSPTVANSPTNLVSEKSLKNTAISWIARFLWMAKRRIRYRCVIISLKSVRKGGINWFESFLQPLWLMDSKSITKEQHDEFYHFISNSYDSPRFTMQYATDAPLAIRALLYIPSSKPCKVSECWLTLIDVTRWILFMGHFSVDRIRTRLRCGFVHEKSLN